MIGNKPLQFQVQSLQWPAGREIQSLLCGAEASVP